MWSDTVITGISYPHMHFSFLLQHHFWLMPYGTRTYAPYCSLCPEQGVLGTWRTFEVIQLPWPTQLTSPLASVTLITLHSYIVACRGGGTFSVAIILDLVSGWVIQITSHTLSVAIILVLVSGEIVRVLQIYEQRHLQYLPPVVVWKDLWVGVRVS